MRNLLLAFVLALPALGFVAAHPAAARPMAMVINSNDASVSLIDANTHAEIKRIPMLREPDHMALTPDNASLIIGDTSGNALVFLDPVTGEPQRRMTVSDPYQLQFSPDGKWLTIAGLARNQIDIYDAATFQLVHRIPASSMPSHVAYSPDSSVVYTSLQGTDSLVAVNVHSGAVLWKTKIGSAPAGVLWLNDRVLVGIMGSDNVAVIDPASGAVERRIVTGRGAHNLFLTPDGGTLYVTNRVDGSISVLDPTTLAVRKKIQLPGGPDDMDFGPDGTIWVSRRFAHSVALLNPATGTFTTIEVGRSPHGIWLNTHMTAPVKVSAR